MLHNAVLVPGAGSVFVLGVGKAKKQQAAEAELSRFFGFADRFVDGEIEDAGMELMALRTPSPGQRKRG